MEEVWKDAIGYEGIYQVSNLGNVKAVARELKIRDRVYIFKEHIMKQTLTTGGYPVVSVYKDRYGKHARVHRLVAEAFIENPKNKRTVNHKNMIKTDNRVENLEWATHSENHKHAYENGRISGMLGKKGELSVSGKSVSQYDKKGNYINTFRSMTVAEEKTDISHKHIGDVCVGRRKTTGGYIWRFGILNEVPKIESKKGIEHHCSKLILDTQTGIYYVGVQDASDAKNVTKKSLGKMLRGETNNKTSLIYV